MKVEQIENGLKITIPKTENYTLEELKQKLINELYDEDIYDIKERNKIELLKVILDYEKNDLSKIKDLITQLQKQESIF